MFQVQCFLKRLVFAPDSKVQHAQAEEAAAESSNPQPGVPQQAAAAGQAQVHYFLEGAV